MRLRAVLSLVLGVTAVGGCNPYEKYATGEFMAGPVDPLYFPSPYVGAGGSRQQAGSGTFTGVKATVGAGASDAVGVYYFPFTRTQLAASGAAALNLVTWSDTTGARTNAVPLPNDYVSDGNCQAPEGYTYELQRDDYRYDVQGEVFTSLPNFPFANQNSKEFDDASATLLNVPMWSYVPVVGRVQYAQNGVACQGFKSELTLMNDSAVAVSKTVKKSATDKQTGIPDGAFLARAIIDPGAAVYRYTSTSAAKDPATGLGLQKWGWYDHYMLAYLDGGEIPTVHVAGGTASAPTTIVRIRPQRVYYPRANAPAAAMKLGGGADVVAFKRGEAGYSPVCEVMTYDPGAGNPLPKSAAEIEGNPAIAATLAAPVKTEAMTSPAGDRYVYCFQVE